MNAPTRNAPRLRLHTFGAISCVGLRAVIRATLCACIALTAHADGLHTASLVHTVLPEVDVVGQNEGTALGSSDAASQGTIGAQQLESHPLQRPAEILEHIPGMVVTQHSGDGKANQYFLRGINLDHGSDFATTVNGMPVNLPTHAHGQGYSDLNFVIPELVQRVDYRKGPYAAGDGDFASAGAANVVYRTRIAQPFADLTLGPHGYQRGVAAGATDVGEALHLLAAVEGLNNNGPWRTPQGLRQRNALLTLSSGTAADGGSVSLSAYSAHWTATDQVPQRLLDAGNLQGQAFGRFDSLDPSDGASTSRNSLSGEWHQRDDRAATQLRWYAVQYDLDLYSNFTYQTASNGTGNSDQFAQRDQRQVLGGTLFRSWVVDGLGNGAAVNTVGLQLRQDRIRAGLFNTTQRTVTATVQDDDVTQTLTGLYAQNDTPWTPWLRTVAGLRLDQWQAQVRTRLPAAPASAPLASASAAMTNPAFDSASHQLSPKLSVVLGPWARTELFINSGVGFHSNDARSTRPSASSSPTSGLTRSRGDEIGLRSQVSDALQTSVALWRLRFDAELVYVGDAGTTEAGRPSQRQGVEWSNHWTPSSRFGLDANLAWTRPRYSDASPDGNLIPNAVQRVGHVSAAWRQIGPWSASMTWRYIGPAALLPDNSIRSRANISSNLRLTRHVSAETEVSLDVLNVWNRTNDDIQYAYSSQLAGEASPVLDRHVHPAEPRTWRLHTRMRF